MTRTKGNTNDKNYKYEVKETMTDKTLYFKNQQAIVNHYGLPRTAIYFMINRPDARKSKDNLEIIKLEPPKPVYEMSIETTEDKSIIKTFKHIDYHNITCY